MRKIDLSSLSWIEPAETRQVACRVALRVAALKLETCGLPQAVRSKEDIRDILVTLGWSVPVDLRSDEIDQIERAATDAGGTDRVCDACVVPGENRRRHFICVRIRRGVVHADCEHTPLHMVAKDRKRKRRDKTPSHQGRKKARTDGRHK